MNLKTALALTAISSAGAGLTYASLGQRPATSRLIASSIVFAAPWIVRLLTLKTSCTFLFVTDTHGAAAANTRLVNAMLKEEGVKFVLHGGDVADNASLYPVWWDQPFQRVLDAWPVFAVPGNHDTTTEMQRRFGTVPRKVTCGNADIFLLPYVTRANAEWLWAEVRRSTTQYRILVMHKAVWPVHDDDVPQRTLLEPILNRIDLVLGGHDHVYQDTTHGPTRQVITISGPKKYDCPRGSGGCVEGTTEYLRVEVDGSIRITRRRVP
jgi:predicted phosphodiesterase